MARRRKPDKPQALARDLTLRQLSEALGLHPNTCRRWAGREIPPPHDRVDHEGRREYRFCLAEIQAWRAEVGMAAGRQGRRTAASVMRERVAKRKRAGKRADKLPAKSAALTPRGRSLVATEPPSSAQPPPDDLRAYASADLDPAAIRDAVKTRCLTDDERAYLADLLDVARQRKEQAEAEKRELINAERRGELVERARVIEAYRIAAGELRSASDTLQRQFGRDAYEVLDGALDRADLALERVVSDDRDTGDAGAAAGAGG